MHKGVSYGRALDGVSKTPTSVRFSIALFSRPFRSGDRIVEVTSVEVR
jgi:hypothetical protein